MSGWIVVHDWERFQHPDAARSNVPPWIKIHTELLSREAYLALTPARRAMLVGIFLEYARTRRALPDDTATLSRRLAQRVLRLDLEALSDAGFIGFSASKVASKDASKVASLEKRREEDPLTPTSGGTDQEPEKLDPRARAGLACRRCGEPVEPYKACSSCGASPRVAGSSARELAKPKKLSPFKRAEAFVRNAGWQLADAGFADELGEFDLGDDERERLVALRASLVNGVDPSDEPNPFDEDEPPL